MWWVKPPMAWQRLTLRPASNPAIAVIDISMPGLAGKALAIRLKEVCPDCKLLTLTVHEDHGYLKQMLEAGVSGYLLKRSAAGNLITALRIVDAGGIYIDPAYSTRVLSGADAGAPRMKQTRHPSSVAARLKC